MHAVAGGRSGPAGDGACFADAFFQNLSIQGLAVTQHRANVFGLIALTHARVNAHLFEQVGHAKGARLIGHDGHDAWPQRGVFEQVAQQAHKGHGGGHFFARCIDREVRVLGQCRHRHDIGLGVALRHVAAQALALRMQVVHLCAVVGGLEELQLRGLLIGQRQVETVSEFNQGRLVEFLLAVGGHLALPGLAHAIAFFGVRQDHRGLALVVGRCGIGRIDLHQVVAATFEAVNLLVGHTLGQTRQLFVLTKEGVAVEAPVFGRKGLHLAVHRVGKRTHQGSGDIAGKQTIPITAPHQLDDVPTSATEQALQLINDAAVATHRSVQALQIAVDHPHQVVELFTRGQRERAHALRLVHLAIAEHAPHLAGAAVLQLAVCEVAHEARVVDRTDRANAHRAGGELPKIRHQPGMRVTAQTSHTLGGCELLAVVRQVRLAQTPFQISACVHARSTVRLKEHQVTTMRRVARMEEVVEAHFKQIGGTGIAGNVPAQLTISGVGLGHHGQRVPAHQRAQPLLHGQVAREGGLLLHRHAVDVGRGQFGLPLHLGGIRQLHQVVQNKARSLWAVGGHQGQKSLSPFGSFKRVHNASGGG